MGNIRRGTCAVGIVCVILGGCTIPDQFRLSIFESSAGSHEQVIAGSLSSVATSTQNSLQRLGMFVNATPEGDDIRLDVRTKAGEQFKVVLTRVTSDAGERTRVRIEGGTSTHEQTVFRVLSEVEIAK